jgi:hypothetical protein
MRMDPLDTMKRTKYLIYIQADRMKETATIFACLKIRNGCWHRFSQRLRQIISKTRLELQRQAVITSLRRRIELGTSKPRLQAVMACEDFRSLL